MPASNLSGSTYMYYNYSHISLSLGRLRTTWWQWQWHFQCQCHVFSTCYPIINWLLNTKSFWYKLFQYEQWIVQWIVQLFHNNSIHFKYVTSHSKMFLINNARYTNTRQANRWGRGNQAVRNGMAEWMTKRWGRGRKRTVTIHDTFVNKVRNGTTQEYMENNRSFDTSSWWGSCSGMETQQNSSSNR